MSAVMIPSEWLDPGAVLPVTAETVATLLAAVKACTFTQGRAAGLEEERPVKWQGRCNNSPWIDLSESDAEYVKDRLGWETRPLYTKPPAVAQPVLAESAPASYVLMPRRLTAENGAKAALSGEFAEKATYHCSQCDHEEPDDGCEECNGKGSYLVDVPIEWDTIKRIYKAAVDLLGKPAAISPTPSEAGKDDSKLDAKDVEWVVNDIAELGVKIKNQFFFLYKGESLVYEDAKHDNGKPMHWRRVFKREFGECAHPINHADYSKIGTVSLEDSDDWKILPAALSSLEVIGKGEKG